MTIADAVDRNLWIKTPKVLPNTIIIAPISSVVELNAKAAPAQRSDSPPVIINAAIERRDRPHSSE